MGEDSKLKFDNKREMDAAALSQAAYVLDQARQNIEDGEACEKALTYNQLLWSIIQADVSEETQLVVQIQLQAGPSCGNS